MLNQLGQVAHFDILRLVPPPRGPFLRLRSGGTNDRRRIKVCETFERETLIVVQLSINRSR